jgi:hypothetical protein
MAFVHLMHLWIPLAFLVLGRARRGKDRGIDDCSFLHTFSGQKARYVRVQSIKPDGPDQVGGQMLAVFWK